MSEDDRTRSFIALTRGTEVSHYAIIAKIGAGGMGEVYLAEDSQLDRKVALKFLPPHLSRDESARARFTREAKAAAKLDHPNIVQVFEVGEFQGRPFFAMAYIEGKSLREVIKEGRLSVSEAIELIKQICEGLHKAHEAGIVHRDIKPGNIIIDRDNKARILDFGLATATGEDKLTSTGSTLGTVGYMSPEQIEGKQVDRRSDIFSVGVILYELITGRKPFAGDNDVAVVKAIVDAVPEPIARYKSGTSDELQSVIDKALAKDRAHRYQDIKSMTADLNRLSLPARKQKAGIRGKYAWSALVVVLLLAALVFKPWKFEVSSTQQLAAHENLLAVMYFNNLADPSDSHELGEIAANLLITDLSESEYVNVVSSQRLYDILRSLGHEGETRIDRSLATEIAREAQSRWMLLGTILQVEPAIIVTSQLVDVSSGAAVASQRIDGDEDDSIFELVDKLTVEIKKDLSLPSAAMTEADTRVGGYTESAEAYRYYLNGWKLLFELNIVEANSQFLKAVQLDSTFAMAYFGLSWSGLDGESQLRAIDKAVRYADRVNEIDRHSILARKAQLDDDYEKAIEELQVVLEKSPNDRDTWHWIGVLYKSIDNAKALESFQKALEIDPTHKVAYNELAYLYNRMGDLEKSIWAVNKYIELAPDEANPYDTRGQLYALNGQLDNAVASYEKALAIDPEFASTQRKLADIYMFNEQYDEATDLYRQLTSHHDKHQRASGRLLLARIPAHQGKFKESARILSVGIEADMLELGEGESVAAKLWVRSILNGTDRGNYDTAIQDIERALEIFQRINPRDEFINHLMANKAHFYAASGRFELAEKTIAAIKSNIEKNASTNYSNYDLARAFVAEERGEYGAFSDLWQPANESRFFAADYYAAVSYFHAGRIGEAVHTLERTINVYDGNRAGWPALSVRVHYWLGRAYEASGWNNKAIEQYETFLQIWRNADDGVEAIEDAKERVARLKETVS